MSVLEHLNPQQFQERINSVGATFAILRRPSEKILTHAWVRLDLGDVLPIVWHERPLSVTDLIAESQDPSSVFYACLVKADGAEEVQIAGLGWVHQLKDIGEGQLTGTCGMAFVREFQDQRYTREFCSMMLDDVFTRLGVASLYGFTPTPNRVACMFHHAMGFDVLATLPSYSQWGGKPCDVQLSCMTASGWEKFMRLGREVKVPVEV